MKKKLQVFVSSTYTDLIEERQAAVQAILDAGHIPAGMELFKSGKPLISTIHKWIDESDVYMLILGGRYGSIENKSDFSYTELEYKYALSKNMPVFAIVLSEDFLEEKAVTKGRENIFEIINPDKFELFKKYIEKNHVKFINKIDDIPSKISLQLEYILNDPDYNLGGWIQNNIITLSGSKEMDTYILNRISCAKDCVYHLSWKDYNPNGYSRPNYTEYNTFQNDLLKITQMKLKQQGFFYKDIFTFHKRDERINKMKNLIKYDNYWCGFFESNEQLQRFPKLHFLIIDNQEVIFACYDYKDNYCSTSNKEIVNIMLSYFEECWLLCNKIKDRDGLNQKLYETIIYNQ